MKVFILATCRKPELLRATTMVFDTIRVGFPTAQVRVFINPMGEREFDAVCKATFAANCAKEKCVVKARKMQSVFPVWFQHLLDKESEPFWICDTDMVFWDKVEDWSFDTALAGRFIPQFFDPYTNCITRPRLHTCLMYIDPVKVRAEQAKYLSQFPVGPYNPSVDFIHPMVQPVRNEGEASARGVFHDSTAVLYQAIGGTAFSPSQNAAFDHLNCGTFSDVVGSKLPMLRETHFAVFENLSLARGLWIQQQEAYQRMAL